MKTIALGLVCMVTSAISILHAQTVTLKFNPANGSRYDVSSTNNFSIKQTVMGQQIDMKFANTVNMRYDITDAGANKNLNLSYDSAKMSFQFMGQETVINSESADTANAANKMFRSIHGKKVNVLIAPDGTVKQAEGFDALTKGMATAGGETQKMADELFSEATVKSLLEQSFKMYPEGPVSPGSTWASDIQIEKPYKLILRNNYTLKKIAGGKSLISVAGKIDTQGFTKMQQQGMEMEINMTGTVTGTITMDNASGITDVSELRQQVNGTVKIQGMEVPMEATVETITDMRKR